MRSAPAVAPSPRRLSWCLEAENSCFFGCIMMRYIFAFTLCCSLASAFLPHSGHRLSNRFSLRCEASEVAEEPPAAEPVSHR